MRRCAGRPCIWAAAIPVRCARCGQPPVSGQPVSLEAKIRGVADKIRRSPPSFVRLNALALLPEVIKAVIAEALVYCTDQQDVPAEVAKRLDWQLDNLEKRALEALEGGS